MFGNLKGWQYRIIIFWFQVYEYMAKNRVKTPRIRSYWFFFMEDLWRNTKCIFYCACAIKLIFAKLFESIPGFPLIFRHLSPIFSEISLILLIFNFRFNFPQKESIRSDSWSLNSIFCHTFIYLKPKNYYSILIAF